MKPCDCKDQITAKCLEEQGISFAKISLELRPSVVVLSVGPCTLTMNQDHFKRLAEWYLSDQEEVR